MTLANLFRFVSLRHLRAKPSRTFLTAAGVALGVALFVAISAINDATLRFFEENVNAVSGQASLTVFGAEGGFSEDKVAAVKDVAGVAAAVPTLETRARVELSGRPARSLVVLGIDFLQESAVRSYRSNDRVVDDPLEFLNQADSIVVTKGFAREQGLALESTIVLSTAHGRRTFVIRGLLEDEGPAKAYGGGIAIMDIDGARASFGKEGKVDRIDVVAAEGVDTKALAGRVAAALGPGHRVEPRDAQAEALARMVRGYQTILAFLSSLALLVGMFLVGNTVTLAIAERRSEIAILRALGASRASVVVGFVVEAAAMGLAGALVGIALGRVVSTSLVARVSESMSRQYVTPIDVASVQLRFAHAALGIAFGVVASALASLLPAWRASRIRGAEAFGRPSVVEGRACLGPRIGRLVELVFRTPILRLASTNLLENPRRTGGNVLALVVGLMLVVVMGTIHQSFRRSIGDWQQRTFKADLVVSASGRLVTLDVQPLAEELAAEIDRVPGVSIEDGRGARAIRVVKTTHEGRAIVIKAVDRPHSRVGFSFLDVTDRSPEEAGAALYDGGDVVLVSESFARHFPGNAREVMLETPSGRRAFRVGGTVIDFAHPEGVVYLSREVYKRHWQDSLVTAFAVQAREGTSVEALRAAIDRDLGDRGLVPVMSRALEAQLDQTLDESFAYTHAVEAAAIGVGLLGMLSTLLMSFLERSRELGTLRAIGMSRGQVMRLVLVESALLGGAGGVAAAVLGIVTARAWVVSSLAGSLGWSITVHVPFASVASTLGAGLAVGLFSGLVIARRIARLPIREALAS